MAVSTPDRLLVVEQRLRARFRDDEVDAVMPRARQELAALEQARIQAFVPILLEKRLVDLVRHREA